MANTLTLYFPGRRFPALSTTGSGCALQCDHCKGRYLQGMRPVSGGDDLLRTALELERLGAVGFLLSGGCDPQGRIDLREYIPAISEIKRSTALKVNVHTGLLDERSAHELIGSGADALSVDMLQDPDTISKVLHLPARPQDYSRTLELLSASQKVVPHVCVGLQSAKGEEDTLDLIARHPVRALIVLGLVGDRGSPWEGKNVDGDRLVRFIEKAARRTAAPVLLGCMRPRGDWTIEARCIESGASGVVNPSPRTVEWAQRNRVRLEKREECCALYL